MKRRILVVLAVAVCLFAQDWKSVDALPSVDLSALTPAQKATALKLLRDSDCSCGCGMKLAECRVKDPNCSFSRGMAGVLVESLHKGMTGDQALAAMKSSKPGQGVKRDTRVLGDKVDIPTAGSPVSGPAGARITIVEFSDFQCPFCIAAIPQLKQLMAAYPADVKLIFKQFPLDNHSQAALAATAALAAHKQGKFWPLHDAMFAAKGHIDRPTILMLAVAAGIDQKRFLADMESPEVKKAVARDQEDGERAGVQGTPTLFLNGRHYNGGVRFEILKDLVEQELKAPVKTAAAR